MKIIYNIEDDKFAVLTLVDQSDIYKKAKFFVPVGRNYQIIKDDELPLTAEGMTDFSSLKITKIDGIGEFVVS